MLQAYGDHLLDFLQIVNHFLMLVAQTGHSIQNVVSGLLNKEEQSPYNLLPTLLLTHSNKQLAFAAEKAGWWATFLQFLLPSGAHTTKYKNFWADRYLA